MLIWKMKKAFIGIKYTAHVAADVKRKEPTCDFIKIDKAKHTHSRGWKEELLSGWTECSMSSVVLYMQCLFVFTLCSYASVEQLHHQSKFSGETSQPAISVAYCTKGLIEHMAKKNQMHKEAMMLQSLGYTTEKRDAGKTELHSCHQVSLKVHLPFASSGSTGPHKSVHLTTSLTKYTTKNAAAIVTTTDLRQVLSTRQREKNDNKRFKFANVHLSFKGDRWQRFHFSNKRTKVKRKLTNPKPLDAESFNMSQPENIWLQQQSSLRKKLHWGQHWSGYTAKHFRLFSVVHNKGFQRLVNIGEIKYTRLSRPCFICTVLPALHHETKCSHSL